MGDFAGWKLHWIVIDRVREHRPSELQVATGKLSRIGSLSPVDVNEL